MLATTTVTMYYFFWVCPFGPQVSEYNLHIFLEDSYNIQRLPHTNLAFQPGIFMNILVHSVIEQRQKPKIALKEQESTKVRLDYSMDY